MKLSDVKSLFRSGYRPIYCLTCGTRILVAKNVNAIGDCNHCPEKYGWKRVEAVGVDGAVAVCRLLTCTTPIEWAHVRSSVWACDEHMKVFKAVPSELMIHNPFSECHCCYGSGCDACHGTGNHFACDPCKGTGGIPNGESIPTCRSCCGTGVAPFPCLNCGSGCEGLVSREGEPCDGCH